MVKFNYKKTKSPIYIFRKLALAILVVVVGAMAISYFWYKFSLKPASTVNNKIIYRVETGDNPTTTAYKLKQNNLIKSELAFKIFIKLNNYNNLLPGEYQLSPSYDAKQIADLVFNSKPKYSQVTFLPGKTIADYRQAMLDAGYSINDVDSALKLSYDNPSLADKPADQGLEGYIRPQTYTKLVKYQDTPESIISQNLAETDKLIDGDFKSKIAAKNLNIHQAFTLASIIQQESSDPDTQRKIAQVFYSRLRDDISLGSDVTFQYAAKITGQTASPTMESEYNTRIHKGLPPGPIGGFTDSALKAVVDPADGDYLFFVAGDDGNTYFSRTNEEHESLKKAHCQKLCKLY